MVNNTAVQNTNSYIVIAALYHFANLPDCKVLQPQIKQKMIDLGIKGTILATPEGLNGTISGERPDIDAFFSYLKEDSRFAGLEHKESFTTEHPFSRAKVKLKSETISIGEPTDVCMPGQYVEPEDWNALISQPDVLVVDTRNDYEVHLGTFRGSFNPKTKTFKELPNIMRRVMKKTKPKKIAMFCTGGIRCEKSTAWVRQQGFHDVYHLKGGILKYLEVVPKEESLWDGDCYVFDDRVAVDHDLNPSETAQRCKPCGRALVARDLTSPLHKHGKQCPHCAPVWQKAINQFQKSWKQWKDRHPSFRAKQQGSF